LLGGLWRDSARRESRSGGTSPHSSARGFRSVSPPAKRLECRAVTAISAWPEASAPAAQSRRTRPLFGGPSAPPRGRDRSITRKRAVSSSSASPTTLPQRSAKASPSRRAASRRTTPARFAAIGQAANAFSPPSSRPAGGSPPPWRAFESWRAHADSVWDPRREQLQPVAPRSSPELTRPRQRWSSPPLRSLACPWC